MTALLFNGFGSNLPFSDCVQVTVGGIWCFEDVCDHHGQEAGQKRSLDFDRNKLTFGSGSLMCQGFRRRREETA